MKAPLWAIELAREFWKAAEADEPFPRSLRPAMLRVFEGSVVYLPHLRLELIRDWLVRHNLPCSCDQPDRPLRACLYARYGIGLVFIDEADPPDEQRFSLAHELAHWLRDYWQPRRQAAERLGEGVLEVFDGKRSPTVDERLRSLMTGLPMGVHVHLMERSPDGGAGNLKVAEAEMDADRLAFELLAPAGTIARTSPDQRSTTASLATLLQKTYGLPKAQARAYARLLLPASRPTDPVLLRLTRNA